MIDAAEILLQDMLIEKCMKSDPLPGVREMELVYGTVRLDSYNDNCTDPNSPVALYVKSSENRP